MEEVMIRMIVKIVLLLVTGALFIFFTNKALKHYAKYRMAIDTKSETTVNAYTLNLAGGIFSVLLWGTILIEVILK